MYLKSKLNFEKKKIWKILFLELSWEFISLHKKSKIIFKKLCETKIILKKQIQKIK